MMNDIYELIMQNLERIVLLLICIILILLMLLIINIIQTNKLQKKYIYFMQGSGEKNIEKLLDDYLININRIEKEQKDLIKFTNDINDKLSLCIQKTSILRYNPFDAMGGDLCFAIALLDAKDNGIVLNGIHSRDGSYVYAKPVREGESTYKLSGEEKEAITKAIRDCQ